MEKLTGYTSDCLVKLDKTSGERGVGLWKNSLALKGIGIDVNTQELLCGKQTAVFGTAVIEKNGIPCSETSSPQGGNMSVCLRVFVCEFV